MSVRREFNLLEIDELPDEDQGTYHTVGGLAMLHLGRIPRTGDVFELEGFEVVDMDRNRVDELIVSRVGDSLETATQGGGEP